MHHCMEGSWINLRVVLFFLIFVSIIDIQLYCILQLFIMRQEMRCISSILFRWGNYINVVRSFDSQNTVWFRKTATKPFISMLQYTYLLLCLLRFHFCIEIRCHTYICFFLDFRIYRLPKKLRLSPGPQLCIALDIFICSQCNCNCCGNKYFKSFKMFRMLRRLLCDVSMCISAWCLNVMRTAVWCYIIMSAVVWC